MLDLSFARMGRDYSRIIMEAARSIDASRGTIKDLFGAFPGQGIHMMHDASQGAPRACHPCSDRRVRAGEFKDMYEKLASL